MKSKFNFLGRNLMLTIIAILVIFVISADLHDQTPVLWALGIILVINVWIFVSERKEKKRNK